MGVDLGKAFSMAFKYAFNVKKMLPFFILNIIAISMLFLIANSVINLLPHVMTGTVTGIASGALTILGSIFIAVVLFVVLALIALFFTGAITDNARHYFAGKIKPISESYGVAKRKYFSMLGASVIALLISMALGMVPLIGFILTIIVSWLFIVLNQIIIVSDETAIESIRKGFSLFAKNTLDVFLFWLLLLIIGIVLLLIAFLPLIIAMAPIFSYLVSSLIYGSSMTYIVPVIIQQMPYLIIASIITAVVLSYITVFQIAAKTFFYVQFTKKEKRPAFKPRRAIQKPVRRTVKRKARRRKK